MNTEKELFLYHYFERKAGPFLTLSALPIEEAREILIDKKNAGQFGNLDIEDFLKKRYDRDEKLREVFVKHGGKPKNTAPVYMMLGEHPQWASAYENPAVIKIPLKEFNRFDVSFSYGDSFAVFNPALFGEEEYWNKLYFADEILKVINRNRLPPYVKYDFKHGIYPTDKNINDHLKYVEAHVWDDTVIHKYRIKWMQDNGF